MSGPRISHRLRGVAHRSAETTNCCQAAGSHGRTHHRGASGHGGTYRADGQSRTHGQANPNAPTNVDPSPRR